MTMTVGMTIRRAMSVMLAVCVLAAGSLDAAAQAAPAALQARQATAAKTVMLPDGPLPDGSVGLPYGTSVTAVGGSGLYSILVSGVVPPGTALVRGGGVIALQGVPTQEGTYTFHVAVTDVDLGSSASHDYSVRVMSQRLLQPHVVPPTVTVNATETFHVADAPSVFFPVKINVSETFTALDGVSALIPPKTLSDLEAFQFTDKVSIFVAAALASTEALHFTDVVSISASPTLGVSPATAPAGTFNAAYSQVFTATGATGAVTLTPSGTLPQGILFSCNAGTCTLSGTPIQAGMFNFNLTAQDTVTMKVVAYSLVIAQATQTINIGPLPTPVYGGAPFSVSATATSGNPVTIAYVSGPATGSGAGPYTATGAGVVNFVATQAGSGSYAAATPVNFSVTVSAASQSITVGALPTPTFGGAPFSVSATATSGLPVTIAYVSGPAAGTGSGPYTATGGGVVNFMATQAGNGSYAAATPVNFSVTVAAASQSITVGALPTPTYGGAPFSVSASSTSGLPVTIGYVSGPATGAGSGPYTATGAGVVNFTATQAGNANYTAAAPVNFSVSVAKQASVTVVSASPTSVTPVQTTTLTANVSGVTTGAPTGSVVFLDNGVPIGTPVQVVGGQAQLTTLLLSGAQLITATYSGDANFLGSSSTSGATVSVAPLEFTMTPLSPTTLNVVPGAAAVVSFNVTPLYLIYPAPVTFSVSGLPSNASYTVTPTSVPVNGGSQTVTVTIQTKAAVAMNFARSTPIALALFVPLLALGVRRRRRWLSALVLLLGVVASGAVVGCGAGTTGNGFFGQAQQRYPVVITATSGTVQHTINVTLDIQ